MKIRFETRGEPQALKRHRSNGKFNYDPSANDKADFLSLVQKHAPEVPFEVPLLVRCWFIHGRPKSHFGTGKNADKLKPSAPKYKTSRPDIDNYEKFVYDALDKVFWKDDSYIVVNQNVKIYGDVPKVIVEVETLDNSLENNNA